MYKPSEVPEVFGVRANRQRQSCVIEVADELKGATEAKLLLSTWSADHAEEIGFNDKKLVNKVGLVHEASFDTIPVPLELIKQGKNEFYIFSTTEHHAAEVNWPGPVLLVEFDKIAPEAK